MYVSMYYDVNTGDRLTVYDLFPEWGVLYDMLRPSIIYSTSFHGVKFVPVVGYPELAEHFQHIYSQEPVLAFVEASYAAFSYKPRGMNTMSGITYYGTSPIFKMSLEYYQNQINKSSALYKMTRNIVYDALQHEIYPLFSPPEPQFVLPDAQARFEEAIRTLDYQSMRELSSLVNCPVFFASSGSSVADNSIHKMVPYFIANFTRQTILAIEVSVQGRDVFGDLVYANTWKITHDQSYTPLRFSELMIPSGQVSGAYFVSLWYENGCWSGGPLFDCVSYDLSVVRVAFSDGTTLPISNPRTMKVVVEK